MDREKRLAYLDVAKAITIICVVVGHMPICPNIIKQIIYAFHMPCFFSLAGYAWNSKENTKITSKFVKKKVKRLLVPCFVWGLLYAFPFSSKTILMIYGNQKAFIVAESLSSLWYLPCLFIAVCLFKEVMCCLQKISDTKRIWGLMVVQLFVAVISFALNCFKIKYGYPWSLDVAIMSMFFIIFGYILHDCYKENLLNTFQMILFIIFCCGVLFFCTIWNLRFLEINNVDMASSSYGNLILFLISGCIGTIIVIAVGIMMVKIFKKISWILCLIGKNTMAIYLIHKPIVVKLSNLIDVNGGVKIIAIVGYAIIAVSIGCTLSLILGKYFPWMIGNQTNHMEKENG